MAYMCESGQRYARQVTDFGFATMSSYGMHNAEAPHIIAAERLNEGLVIKFADGQCAFYSQNILFWQLSLAEHLDEAAAEW